MGKPVFGLTTYDTPHVVCCHFSSSEGIYPRNTPRILVLSYRGVLDYAAILAIHEDYFQLSGGLERWLYWVARKHAGKQANGVFISLPTLHLKAGGESRYRQFKYDLRRIVERDELPEYHLEWGTFIQRLEKEYSSSVA